MIKTLEDYQKQYNLSVSNPEKFWNDYSDQFIWRKKATKILDWNFESPDIKWFQDGSLNITENIFERNQDKKNQTAIVWEPNEPNDKEKSFTYGQLFEEVCRFANVLKNLLDSQLKSYNI